MNNERTKKAEVLKALAVAEAIRDLGSVPSGHLYANLMGCFSLSEYTRLIDILKSAQLIKEEGHLLTWIDDGGKDKSAGRV